MFSKLATRLAKLPRWKSIQAASQNLFTRHLLATNTVICSCSFCISDILVQRFQIYIKGQEKWLPRRTVKLALIGVTLGPMAHYNYIILDRIFPGKSLAMLAKRIFTDMIISTPLYSASYLLILGFVDGSNWKKIKHNFITVGPSLLKVEYLVWQPAQVVNFCFVPLRYRMLYENLFSVGVDGYYVYARFDKTFAASDD